MNDRLRALAHLLRRPSVHDEVDEEFAFHVEMMSAQLIAAGLSPQDARGEAIRRFGDMRSVTMQCERFGRQRDWRRSRAEYLAELWRDMSFATRQLSRARGFTLSAALTLALGIGGTAAVFSVLYAVVLQPLPYPAADRIVQLETMQRGAPLGRSSGSEFAELQAMRRVFEHVAATVPGSGVTLTGSGDPEVIPTTRTTAGYFQVFGVAPALGRGFVESDENAGAPAVAILSHRLWMRRFSGDDGIVGRQIELDERPTTVVGVMPASFDVIRDGDELLMPLQVTPTQRTETDNRWLVIVARLAPGLSVERANAAVASVERRIEARASKQDRRITARVHRYLDTLVGDARQRLIILFGAVGLVLIIACVNVSNLLLARGASRSRELAIRAALGAGAGRLVRQLLAESLVLGLLGAALGIGFALAFVRGIVALAPHDVPRLDAAGINPIVLAFTLGVAILTSVCAGLVPAVKSASPRLHAALREGGRGSSIARERFRAVFVATEVALTLALLTGSGLLIRTAWQLQHVNPGFDAHNVLAARAFLPGARYGDAARIVQTFDHVREAIARVPGVREASLVTVTPLSGSSMRTSAAPEGRALAESDRVDIDVRYASQGYFDTMKMPLLDGRDLARTDGADAPAVGVISQSLAKALWPGERAVGRRFDAMSFDPGKPNWITVVGVVADVHDVGLGSPVRPAIYLPIAQMNSGFWAALQRSLEVVVRTSPEPRSLVPRIRHAVAQVDASIPLAAVQTMDDYLAASVATARFNTMLLAALGVVALVLASVGVYGVVAYFVSQRTREIGVRLALGASPGQIRALVFRRSAGAIAAGALIGTLLSVLAGRILREQLFGVSAVDPLTLASTIAVLLVVAAVAMGVPARRAMRIPPAMALTSE